MSYYKSLSILIALQANLLLCHAASINDSVTDIPKGTVFTLNHELEIPTNKNFIPLGVNRQSQSFNQINQTFNQQNNNYNNLYPGNYKTYNRYFTHWGESTNRSYKNCLDRHRIHYSYNKTPIGTNNNVVVNNAYGNTNVIINNNVTNTGTYGSYQGRNTCIKPEQTISALLINKHNTQGGGAFAQGYTFKVDKVKYSRDGYFYFIDILFKHKVLKGIRIATSISPSDVKIYQLQSNKSSGDGFWNTLGDALSSSVNIGGEYFTISFPKKRYYD